MLANDDDDENMKYHKRELNENPHESSKQYLSNL
jgi:hypothetical protein